MSLNISELEYMPKAEVNEIRDKIYLSNDENDVLDMALYGKSAQQISIDLCMSERSVYRIRHSINLKLSKL